MGDYIYFVIKGSEPVHRCILEMDRAYIWSRPLEHTLGAYPWSRGMEQGHGARAWSSSWSIYIYILYILKTSGAVHRFTGVYTVVRRSKK